MSGQINKYKAFRGYESLPREMLQDKSLSLEAIGLLANLQSYPDDWKLYKTELYGRFPKNKRTVIERIWDELVNEAYMLQFRKRVGKAYEYSYFYTVEKFTYDQTIEVISQMKDSGYLFYHKDMIKNKDFTVDNFDKYIRVSPPAPKPNVEDQIEEMESWFSTVENQHPKKDSHTNVSSTVDFQQSNLNSSNPTASRFTIQQVFDDDDEKNNNTNERAREGITLSDLHEKEPKILPIAKYFFHVGLEHNLSLSILKTMVEEPALINSRAIIQQMSWCIDKAQTEGISDFYKYFINGLRDKTQFTKFESNDQLAQAFIAQTGGTTASEYSENLPQVPLYNWTNPEKNQQLRQGEKYESNNES